MPEPRYIAIAGLFSVLVLGAALFSSTCVGAPRLAPQDVQTVIVGRDGWIHDTDDAQGFLRVDLADPESAGRGAGLMMMTCDDRGYHVYFGADPSMRHKIPDLLSDGFVHFFLGEIGSTDPAASHRVTIYVTFASGLTFRSSRSDAASADPVEALVDFLLSAERTAMLILSPRLGTGGFRRDARVRLIFEPGNGAAALSIEDAIAAFWADCHARSKRP